MSQETHLIPGGHALAACKYLQVRHPHEVPCITAVPITDGNAAFLRWIGENSLPLRHDAAHLQPL